MTPYQRRRQQPVQRDAVPDGLLAGDHVVELAGSLVLRRQDRPRAHHVLQELDRQVLQLSVALKVLRNTQGHDRLQARIQDFVQWWTIVEWAPDHGCKLHGDHDIGQLVVLGFKQWINRTWIKGFVVFSVEMRRFGLNYLNMDQ